jgi:hypothetical protein
MTPRSRPERPPRRRAELVTDADRVLGIDGATVVDILDRLLTKGVIATGDLTLGVAGVDLVYVRLSALVSAVDRVLKPHRTSTSAARLQASRAARPRSGSTRQGGKKR